MAEIVGESSIARPSEEVWDALADFGGISAWAPTVDHSCLTTDQSEGAGSVRRVQVGRHTVLERVVIWEPGRELAYAIEGLPPIARSVTNTWTIGGSGDSTTVTLTSRVDAGPRPPQQLVARAVARVLGKTSREMLSGLKTHVEEAS